MDSATGLQPLACKILEDSLTQGGVDPVELRKDDHLFSCHFQSSTQIRQVSASRGEDEHLMDLFGAVSMRNLTTSQMPMHRDEYHVQDQHLLRILYQLNPRGIPIDLIRRGSVPQYRWNDSGERTQVLPQETGLSERFAYFGNSGNLEQSLHRLTLSKKLSVVEDNMIRVEATARNALAPDEREWWKEASALICHAFPRGETLDPEYCFQMLVRRLKTN